MIKYILGLFLISFSVCFSQYYMYIHNKDGTVQTFDINEIKKLTFDNITNIEDADKLTNILESFTLLQNYPNPFNPSTTIQYIIPKSGSVQVKVYNINGQLVRTILNQFQNAGSHKIEWDSKNDHGQKVSSGVYIYSVRFKRNNLSKKLMLVK